MVAAIDSRESRRMRSPFSSRCSESGWVRRIRQKKRELATYQIYVTEMPMMLQERFLLIKSDIRSVRPDTLSDLHFKIKCHENTLNHPEGNRICRMPSSLILCGYVRTYDYLAVGNIYNNLDLFALVACLACAFFAALCWSVRKDALL